MSSNYDKLTPRQKNTWDATFGAHYALLRHTHRGPEPTYADRDTYRELSEVVAFEAAYLIPNY